METELVVQMSTDFVSDEDYEGYIVEELFAIVSDEFLREIAEMITADDRPREAQ